MSRWLENETKLTSIFTVLSAISLILSITGVLKTILPVDVAWIAIILCGVPILVGAIKGLVFEHDIKADVLVAMALVASVATGEYFVAGEVALIMQIGSLLEDYTSGKARESAELFWDRFRKWFELELGEEVRVKLNKGKNSVPEDLYIGLYIGAFIETVKWWFGN